MFSLVSLAAATHTFYMSLTTTAHIKKAHNDAFLKNVAACCLCYYQKFKLRSCLGKHVTACVRSVGLTFYKRFDIS